MSDDDEKSTDNPEKKSGVSQQKQTQDSVNTSKGSKTDSASADTNALDTIQPGDPEPTKSEKGKDNLFNAKPAPRMQSKGTSKKRLVVSILAIILAILALIGVGWSAYNQYKMQQDWNELQARLEQQAEQQFQVAQTSKQIAQSSQQTAISNQQAASQQAQLIQQLRQALTATQQKVKELSGRQQQDWLLAEAEYLIKLAQLKVTLEKDKTTAIALLKTADQRILQTADNTLLELRQVIAQDITDLEMAVAPDINGIASQLHAVIAQVVHLDLVALEFEPLQKTFQPPEDKPGEFSWEALYQNFLKDFVVIKDHSEPAKPLMTLEQRGNLNANIQLAIQQAQIALVREEQGLYEINLDNAIEWVGKFFQQNQASQTILDKLAELRRLQINILLPQKLDANEAIQTINKQRLYQWLHPKKDQIEEEPPISETTETEVQAQVPLTSDPAFSKDSENQP